MIVFKENHENDEFRAVKKVITSENWSRATYYDGKTIFLNGAIPCLVVGDAKGDQTNLNEFYRQLR